MFNSKGRVVLENILFIVGTTIHLPLLLILLLCKKYPSLTGISEREIL